jgi:hypothetical protein
MIKELLERLMENLLVFGGGPRPLVDPALEITAVKVVQVVDLLVLTLVVTVNALKRNV